MDMDVLKTAKKLKITFDIDGDGKDEVSVDIDLTILLGIFMKIVVKLIRITFLKHFRM